jgi:CelD/BcsL family acetyltransferase involved in cellulose biosynthesis
MNEASAMKWTLYDVTVFERFGSEWDEINEQGGNLPILDSSFFRLLLQTFSPSSAVLAVCHAADAPVAAALLSRVKHGVWQTYQPPQAPLGAWIQKSTVALPALVTSLSAAMRPRCLVLSISQVDPDILPRPMHTSNLETLDYIAVPRLTISGPFDDYWAARGKNLIKNMKRQRNLLAREGVETRFEWVTEPPEVASAVDDYGYLESTGWKKSAGTAVHPENAQGRFYRELLRAYAERREALALRYFYDDRLVATDLCLLRHRVLYLLKTTYDERERTTSPSSLLRLETVKRLFDSGSFSRIEFYGRVMDWHKKWTSEFRGIYHVNYFPSRWTMWIHSLKRNLLSQWLPRATAATDGPVNVD